MTTNPLDEPTLDPTDFKCDICGAELDSLSELSDHKKSHVIRVEREDELRGDIGQAGLPMQPQP